MNKTTEALKLAEEALEELHYSSGTVKAVTLYKSALAAIREALAEPVCKRCNGTKLVYDGEIDNIGGVDLEVPIECVKDCPDCAKPVKQEPRKCACGANLYINSDGAPTSRPKPVKQEPVAWMDFHGNVKNNEEINDYIAAGWGKDKVATYSIRLYAAPVDAKAIRAEALEEAAKVCRTAQAQGLQSIREAIEEAIRELK